MHESRTKMLGMGSWSQFDLNLEPRFALKHTEIGRQPWETLADLALQEVGGLEPGNENHFLEDSGPEVVRGPEVVSDPKPKRWSSGRLQGFLSKGADLPRLNPQLEAHHISISKARIENPDTDLRICWSSLGALLLYFMGGDDKAGSKERVAWFLEQARHTFEIVVERFEELHVDQSAAVSIDEIHIKAFQEQLKAWPKGEALSLNQAVLETPGIGVTANMKSEVHPHPPQESNDNISHGTILTLETSGHRLKRPAMGPVDIAAIMLVLHCCHRDINLSHEFEKFLFCYLAGQEPCPRAAIWHSHDPDISGTLRMEFHFRCFGRGRVLTEHQPTFKILCHRSQSLDLGINISERRRSIALLSPFYEKDGDIESTGDYVVLRILDDEWEEAESVIPENLHLCQPWTSVSMFQQILYKELGWWAENWREVLHTIDALVSFEISDVLDTKSRGKLMYDDDKLNTSETYFTVLQLLRVFKNWTCEPEDDIRKLIQQFNSEMDKVDTEAHGAQHIIETNWANVLSHARSLTKDIADRIERKINEVQSLRDGLYNTMQVREATRNTKMSQIMLVFTIATIIYLPLTFVAAVLALDIFPVTTAQFWGILTGTSAITYLLSTMGLFAIYRKGPFDWLRNRVQRMYEAPERKPRLSSIPLPDTKYQDRFNKNITSTDLDSDTADPLLLGPAGLLPSGWKSHFGPNGRYFVNTDTGQKMSSRPKPHFNFSDTSKHTSHAASSDTPYFFGPNVRKAPKRPKYWRAGDGSSRVRLHEAQKVFSSVSDRQ